MEDMDFTKPQAEAPVAATPFKAAASRFYDAKAAAEVFRACGREERFAAGQVLFEEDDRVSRGGLFRTASRMYYVVEGDVALTLGGKRLDAMGVGDVFGEMAVVTGQPRSATATARAAGSAFSMDGGELQAAIGKHPEFALMLASVMYDRLRFLAARLAARPKASGGPHQATTFEPSLVAQLESLLPAAAKSRYATEAIVMREGQAGTFMYLVKAGRIGIAVGNQAVEIVGPGGTFGEMAVVDQSPRTASAQALEDTELLAIDRRSLLQAIGTQPAIAMALLRAIAERLRHMNAVLQ
jgi:CRP-like cAMP-binding protein